ncbi:MAG: hypothetical protein PHH00_01740 [Candidatus Nanoarchaeia archaeon]|nr:hypothetical protein [Candidatus Nanoarchaeia archaeon]
MIATHVFEGMTSEQYEKAGAELGAICNSIGGELDGTLIFTLDRGEARAYDSSRKVELSDDVDEAVIDALRNIKSGASQ